MKADSIINWLLDDTLHLHCVEKLITELAPRLANVANVNYISVDIYTVRCEVAVRNLTWCKGKALQTKILSLAEAEIRFINSKTMCADHKNCIVLPLRFTRGKHTHIAYASPNKQGFSADEVKSLQYITPALARRFEIESYHHFYGFSGVVENFWKIVSDRCREVDKAQGAVDEG